VTSGKGNIGQLKNALAAAEATMANATAIVNDKKVRADTA